MTKRECAIVMAYTGVCMCAGENLKYFYEYVSELMGRPVYTHEFAALADEIKERAKDDFVNLCKEAEGESEWILENHLGLQIIRCPKCNQTINCNQYGLYYKEHYRFCPFCGKPIKVPESPITPIPLIPPTL